MLIESRSSRVYSSKKKMFLGYQKRLYFGIHLYLLYGTWAWAQPRNKLYPYRIRTVKSFSEKMILNTYAPTMKSRDQDYQTLNPCRHIHTHTYTQKHMWVCVCVNFYKKNYRLEISKLRISQLQTLQVKMMRLRCYNQK